MDLYSTMSSLIDTATTWAEENGFDWEMSRSTNASNSMYLTHEDGRQFRLSDHTRFAGADGNVGMDINWTDYYDKDEVDEDEIAHRLNLPILSDDHSDEEIDNYYMAIGQWVKDNEYEDNENGSYVKWTLRDEDNASLIKDLNGLIGK